MNEFFPHYIREPLPWVIMIDFTFCSQRVIIHPRNSIHKSFNSSEISAAMSVEEWNSTQTLNDSFAEQDASVYPKLLETEKYGTAFLLAYISYLVIMLVLSFFFGFYCPFPSCCCCFKGLPDSTQDRQPPKSTANEKIESNQSPDVHIIINSESKPESIIIQPELRDIDNIIKLLSIKENVKKAVNIIHLISNKRRLNMIKYLPINLKADHRCPQMVEVV